MDQGETICPIFTWTWSDATEGPTPFYPSISPSPGARYFFRGPYDSDCVWNLADNAVVYRGEACHLSILDIDNALRFMSIEDQDRFKFQMSRVLSVSRLLEARCQGLFTGLIDAQRCARDEAAKKKKARKEKEEMKTEVEQQQESQEEKTALKVMFDDEQVMAAGLRHDLKRAEASIAHLNTRLTDLNSDKDASLNNLQIKLAAAAVTEATSMVKWYAERQQLRDEIARAQREERRAKQDRDEAKETIRRARMEHDGNRQSANPTSPSDHLFCRSSREETTPVRGHPDRHSSASGQKALGSDTPMSPRSGANLHRGSRDKQTDEAGTAITAIAQSMLTGPPVALSNAHLTHREVAKLVAHQRVQLEAGTFDARTLSTSISERSWTTIGFTIASSRTLRENPSDN